MDVSSLKIQMVQNILKINNEEDLNMLDEVISSYLQMNHKKMTYQELQNHIDQSEADFKNNQFKESDELLKKYQNQSKDV